MGDGGEAKIVFAAALGHRVEERRRVLRLHHPPRLVDDEQALLQVFAHRIPYIVGHQVHGHGLEVVLHVAHGKDDKLFVDVDVGGFVDKARPRAFGVFGEALYQRLAPLQPREHQLKVAQERRLYLGKIAVDGDVLERVGFGDGAVDDSVLLGCEPAEHDAEHPYQRHNVRAQDVRRRLVLARQGQVEGVDVIFGVERYVEVAPAHCLGQKFVHALGVDDNNLGVKHQRAQDFEFGGVAFAGAGFGKDNGVVVLQTKAVKEHQTGVMAVDPVEYPLVGREVEGNKGED